VRTMSDHARPSSRLATGVQQSGARKIMDLANRIPDAIHLEIGEPDFTAAPYVVEAAVRAIRAGLTQYPPTSGLPALQEGLADKLGRVNAITARPDDIIVTNGGGQGLFNALATLLDAGDRIALPDPGWPNYRSMAALLGLRVSTYSLPPETGHHPDPAQIEERLREGCKAIVLNSPSNPLGTVTPRGTVEAILALATRYQAWIVSDECYDQLYFDTPPTSPAAIDPDADVLSVFSFSKVHAMTGWRIGYVVGPPAVSGLLAKAQEPLVLGVSAPGQHAAIAAVTGPTTYQEHMVGEYRSRRDAVLARFRERGIDVGGPEGAFYLWLDIRDAPLDDTDFVLSLLEHEHVAITAGSSFGPSGRGFVRMSLAASQAQLVEATERLARHLDQVRSAR
jgi:aspartate aminotransferase